jgi:hypothetical protein
MMQTLPQADFFFGCALIGLLSRSPSSGEENDRAELVKEAWRITAAMLKLKHEARCEYEDD